MIQHAPVSIQLSPISFKFINMKKKHTHTHTLDTKQNTIHLRSNCCRDFILF